MSIGHIDWHNSAGMAMTFVEGGDVARRKLQIPEDAKRICRQNGIFV